jgi:hypothetical protein
VKTKFLNKKIKYDGSQLKPLDNYLKYNLLGDSSVSFIGPCDVSFDKMADGEDLKAKAKICGDEMLHFVFEIFHQNLFSAVSFQRLFAGLVKEVIEELKPEIRLKRKGDDLYFNNRKLSISIAAPSVNSMLIHFAINVVNEGTPVKTACLNEFKIKPKAFALEVLKRIKIEFLSIKEATVKVKSV